MTTPPPTARHDSHSGLHLTAAQLSEALELWKADCANPLIAAAVTLLQEHESWLHRTEFRRSCVYRYSDAYPESAGKASIRWAQVPEFLDGNPHGSTSEWSILRFACALAVDEYSLSALGHAHLAMVRNAFVTATTRRNEHTSGSAQVDLPPDGAGPLTELASTDNHRALPEGTDEQ
jgi:hypothetical protein